MVKHNYTLKSIRELINIRYGKDLYLGYGKSSAYHFFYGIKRIVIEIVRSILYLFSSLRKKRICNSEVAVYSTNNQYRAISVLLKEENRSSELVEICKLSTAYSFLRLVVWFVKLCIFPFFFLTSKSKEGVYFSCFTSGMVVYNYFLIRAILNNGVESLIVSNDHAGDIYILSILIRKHKKVSVTYVQHGAAKPEFPINYFDSVYVTSPEYRSIYEGLSKNKDVSISVLCLEMNRNAKGGLDEVDILVCFSHQFYMIEVFRLFKVLGRIEGLSVRVRFHPSDRFIKLKLKYICFFKRSVLATSSEFDYKSDFDSANKIICASSSLLIDGFNAGYSNKIVWYKPIGLLWDYYNLSGKIEVLETVEELKEYLYEI